MCFFMFFFVKSTAGFDYEDAYKKRESLAVSTHLSFPPPAPVLRWFLCASFTAVGARVGRTISCLYEKIGAV